MSRIGKNPVAGAERRRRSSCRRPDLTAKGRLGELAAGGQQRGDRRRSPRTASHGRIRPTTASRRARCGARPAPRQQHGDRRAEGLHRRARDHRRRLPRRGPGQESEPAARLQPRHQVLRSPRTSRSSARRRPRSPSAAPTASASARSPPRSAASARPSPTRARASNMPARTSSARKARRSSRWQSCRSPVRRRRRAGAPRSQGHGQRSAAALGVPLVASTSMRR